MRAQLLLVRPFIGGPANYGEADTKRTTYPLRPVLPVAVAVEPFDIFLGLEGKSEKLLRRCIVCVWPYLTLVEEVLVEVGHRRFT